MALKRSEQLDKRTGVTSTRRGRQRGKITQTLVNDECVEERAKELALIAGRPSRKATESDKRQAKGELLGNADAANPSDDPGIVSSGMGSPPVSHGTQTENLLPDDDRLTERTVEEGVEEAEHDEMVEAARTGTRCEG